MLCEYSGKFLQKQCKIQLYWGNLGKEKVLESSFCWFSVLSFSKVEMYACINKSLWLIRSKKCCPIWLNGREAMWRKPQRENEDIFSSMWSIAIYLSGFVFISVNFKLRAPTCTKSYYTNSCLVYLWFKSYFKNIISQMIINQTPKNMRLISQEKKRNVIVIVFLIRIKK